MKKYIVLAAVAVFTLTQATSAQTTTTTTNKATKEKGGKGDKGSKGGKGTKENKGWQEMKNFHHFMSGTFHPAEDNDFAPLRAKADSMYLSAVAWQLSAVPANYKEKETKETLTLLVSKTKAIAEAVKKNATNEELMKMITEAHDIFHKIMGECRKEEGDKH